jgi:hypothetical protein
MGVRESPDKVAQSNTSKDESITGGRKFQTAPYFIPMFQNTVDEHTASRWMEEGSKPHRPMPKVHQTALDKERWLSTAIRSASTPLLCKVGGMEHWPMLHFHPTASALDSMQTSTN